MKKGECFFEEITALPMLHCIIPCNSWARSGPAGNNIVEREDADRKFLAIVRPGAGTLGILGAFGRPTDQDCGPELEMFRETRSDA